MTNKINISEILHQGPRKRVLFVVTQPEMGGAQRFFLELLPRLDPQKYEINIAVGEENKPQKSEFLDKLNELGFKIFPLNKLQREISFLFFKDWLAVFELRKLIKNLKPDVLFLNSSKAGFIGSLAVVFPSKLKPATGNLRIIYRIGGWTFNDPWPWWKKKFWIILEKISARWKDLIIVNNQHDLDQARQLKIGPGKICLIHNGLDPYCFEFLAKDEAKLKLLEKAVKISGKVWQAKTIIGTVANFYPTKGLTCLIEAAALLPDKEKVVFFIIGDGELAESLKFKVKSLKLENKVFFLGHLENAKQYLPAFDIFLLPSLKEGFPWVVLEAMSAKLPVIATPVGALPEIIINGKNGLLIEPANAPQIAKKILELADNDHLKRELGLQAHQTVLFKFPLEKMVREIEAVL